jgi:hypothetical protein
MSAFIPPPPAADVAVFHLAELPEPDEEPDEHPAPRSARALIPMSANRIGDLTHIPPVSFPA